MVDGLPGFIKPKTDGVANAFPYFNFWMPPRGESPEQDRQIGRECYFGAEAVAVYYGSPGVLIYVISDMPSPIGEVERGFLEALCTRARCGIASDVPPGIVSETVRLYDGKMTEDELACGSSVAQFLIELARADKTDSVLLSLMIEAVEGRFGYGHLSFVWVVCNAARSGALS